MPVIIISKGFGHYKLVKKAIENLVSQGFEAIGIIRKRHQFLWFGWNETEIYYVKSRQGYITRKEGVCNG